MNKQFTRNKNRDPLRAFTLAAALALALVAMPLAAATPAADLPDNQITAVAEVQLDTGQVVVPLDLKANPGSNKQVGATFGLEPIFERSVQAENMLYQRHVNFDTGQSDAVTLDFDGKMDTARQVDALDLRRNTTTARSSTNTT